MKRLAPIAVLLMLMTGCSWLFMEHESNYSGYHEPRCTTSKGWAILDGIHAIGDGAAIAALAESKDSNGLVTAVVVAFAVLDTAAAVTGYSWASSCQESRDQFDGVNPSGTVESSEAPEAATLRRERVEQLKRQRALVSVGVDAGVETPIGDAGE